MSAEIIDFKAYQKPKPEPIRPEVARRILAIVLVPLSAGVAYLAARKAKGSGYLTSDNCDA